MEQRLEWFGTLRGRLGVTPTPGSLLYATGGLAVGRIKTSGAVGGSSLSLVDGVASDVDPDGNPVEVPIVVASADPTASTFFSQKTKAGWTLGAGAEVRLGGNWTGKVEYLYLDFGNVSTTAMLPTNATPLAISFVSRVTENLVRVGLNYKFDPIGALDVAPAGVNAPLVFKAPIRMRGAGPASMSAAASATAGASPIPTPHSAMLQAQANCSRLPARATRGSDRGRPGRLQLGRRQCAGRCGSRPQLFRPGAQECEPVARVRSAIPLSSAS
jgi:hypothetical protein